MYRGAIALPMPEETPVITKLLNLTFLVTFYLTLGIEYWGD